VVRTRTEGWTSAIATALVNGISVDYGDDGVGEPLVLVQGHPFDRSMWRPQVDGLSGARWRVITPDLRGYGRSSVVAGKTPLGTFAGDIVALLDQLGIERFALGGLSMGGQIVMELYRLRPKRVSRLVLADTSAAAETPDGRQHRYDLADRLSREGKEVYAREVLPMMIWSANIEALPDVAGGLLTMMCSAPAEGAAAALRGRAERPDHRPLLRQVSVPTLVVVGRHDQFTPVRDAEALQRAIPRAEVVVIDGAARLPNLERPGEFNAALARFLRGRGTGAAAPAPE